MEDKTSPPAPGWVVQLCGHDFDLRYWERSLKPPFDPWCERIPREGDVVWALRSHSFDQAQNANEVRGRGMLLIERLNGALRVLEGAEPLKFLGVCHIDDKGKLQCYNFAELKVQLRGDMLVSAGEVAEGNLKPLPAPSETPAQRWIKAAEANDGLADLLTQTGRADNWFDIYKALEVAKRLAGSHQKLKGLLGNSATAYDDLKQTANYYRHARGGPHSLPKKPPTEADAKPLISYIVRTIFTARVG